MDPAKLKVVELRAELAARGLDTKGVKAVLVERLKEALEEETGQGVPDTSIVETSTEEADYSEDKVDYSEPDKDNSEPEQQQTPESDENQDQPSEDQNQEVEESYQEFEQDDSQKEQEPPSPEPERESTPEPESQVDYPEQENTFESENYGSEAYQSESYQSAPAPAEEQAEYSESQKVEEAEDKSQDAEMENITIKQESFGDEFKQQHYEEKPDITQYQGFDQENDKKEHYEAEVKMEPGVEVKEERDDRQDDRKRKRSRWSPQPQQKQGWGQRADWGRKDDEPDLDENAMVLGWYDSDLNIEINREDFLEAAPMSAQGFGYIWAGCRATFGFNQGNVCYEVKLLENHDVTHLEDEPSPHVLRVGWSTLDTDMMLGEEPKSYGYGGTGKVSTNCKFSNYGCSFVVGDVVTAYLEYGEDRVKLSYGVNGKFLGEAFNFPLSEIDSQPLFPHILSKNIKFRVNFGLSDPECPVEPGYTWAAHVPLEQRVAGPRRPERREDCEMLMMCGLPGCGKTTWANAFVKENRDKFYNILGTNNLIDKMKIQGLPRKRNYHGRWDVLIDKCTKCLNKLLEMASRRRRNYILDQTNVYPSAQKRKMRNFGGFIRRAIVIVPNDEEFQRRCAKREAEEGKDIPDSAVLEMKANFRLPEEGEHFDEVRFIELNREESQPLVEQYNKEGRAAGFGQQSPFGQGGGNKKFRPNDRPPFRGGGGFRGGRGGFGGGMDRKDRGPDRGPGGRGGFRSGGMDRGGRGGWGPRGGGPDRGPPRGGGWRDRSPGSGGFDRDMDSRAPGGGPWRNQRGNDRDRPYDRSQRGGPRGGGGNFRDNDYGNRGGGFRDGGYDRDDYRGGGGGYNNREDNFRDGRGGGRGRGGRGGFDRDNKGGGRGGFDRNRGGFNDRRGGGNRDGGFDRNRGGDNRGPRDNKGGGGQGNQGGQGGGGWGNQTYQGGWGQQGYNQQGYNQQYNQGYNQGYNQQQQQPNAQQGWGQQAWGNKGTGQQQGVAGATGATATAAATGYNTAGYAQQATGYNQAAGYQGYWGQYGYGQGWTQNADGTYSYPQGWQGYGYNYGAAMTPAAGVTPGMTAATPAAAAATPAAPQAPANK